MEPTSRHERAKAALLVLILGTLLGVLLAIPVSYAFVPHREWDSWFTVNGFKEARYDERTGNEILEWSIPTLDDFIPSTD